MSIFCQSHMCDYKITKSLPTVDNTYLSIANNNEVVDSKTLRHKKTENIHIHFILSSLILISNTFCYPRRNNSILMKVSSEDYCYIFSESSMLQTFVVSVPYVASRLLSSYSW